MKIPGKIPSSLLGAILLFVLCLSPGALGALDSSRITGIDIRPQTNEVELTVDGAIEYGCFPLSEPDRLVFDFPGSILDINNGGGLIEEISDAWFREVRMSQFSVDPPIARLVLYLNNPAYAVVDFDPYTSKLTIEVKGGSGVVIPIEYPGQNVNLLAEDTSLSVAEIPASSSAAELTEPGAAELTEPGSTYNVTSSESEVLVTFPDQSADNIKVSQLRFPDRLNIRIFTNGSLEDGERPRFDILARGNIWNEVARQWVSHIDRDGRGVINLIVYLYPDVTYSQSIGPDGIPEVRLFALDTPPMIAEEPEPVIEDLAETEVAAYTPDSSVEVEIRDANELFETPPEVTEENEDSQILVINTKETIEIINEGHLEIIESGGDIEEIDVAPAIGVITDPDLSTSPDIDEQLVVETQNNILSGSGHGRELDTMYMRVGEVVVMQVRDLIRASMGNPSVATLNVISRNEILITALASGTTTLLVWNTSGGYITQEISVLEATSARQEEINAAINNESITIGIIMSGESEGTPGVVLEGAVDTEEEKLRAHMIASLYAGDRVMNLIEVTDPRQVLVKVRVVEIDKRAMDEHLSHFSAAARADNDAFTIGIITDLLDPENPGGGLYDTRVRPGIVNGNVEDVVFDPIDMVLNELESNRQANILSEPNLVSLSGHEAHFRVGGEIPYTYLNENGVTVVEFKEFGISLDMTPYVDSQDNIRLQIAPTVRTVDMALAIAGIPGFRTREMETEVQLRPGETLVVGGLIQNEITEIISKIPILSEIPILGELFRSKRFNEDITELVIFITPYLIDNPSESEGIVGVYPETWEEEL